ncbi:YtpR family tRNA-binding protein [Metabacillus sp. 84]|uniref:YtpR family tRNA-binding protein n=1 Tax=Metabacillus sp. 84 TaxID=3404705 RepID=UPI003CF7AA3C
MNVFYNREGIGDTLLIFIKEIPREKRAFDRRQDAVRIYDAETKDIAGYNLFHASKYIAVNGAGPLELSEGIINDINKGLSQNGFEEKLEVDFSPKFVIGHVVSKEKHPNADKLNICKVNIGTEMLQIVCGAPNVNEGQKVVVAKVGAVMPSGMMIKHAELRGVASSGMICSAKELDLPDAPQEKGILVLDDSRTPGDAFFE